MDAVSRQSRDSIEQGSKSFAAAARLFDPATRDSVSLLYAWCRHCDDVIDGQVLGFARAERDPTTPQQRLQRLVALTEAAYAGAALDDPVFQAFARVVRRHGIDRRYPLDLLEGFRFDVEGAGYETLEDTLRYCYHVAGVVGVMMAQIMGVRDEPTVDRACDLGLAFQLTNIARDIAEDAANGRCYIPAAWLQKEGVGRDMLLSPAHAAAASRLSARLVDAAEPYYESALIGIRRLPLRSAWAIAAARNVYRAIGSELVRRGERAALQRVTTSPRQKVLLAILGGLQAVSATRWGRRRPEPARVGLWTRPR
jgi:phytoene synthase